MLGEVFSAVLAGVVAVALATPSGPVTGRYVEGADISWPNCPEGLGIPSRRTLGLPLPKESARFVVIGLTNGPAFHPNPCLGAHVAHAEVRGLWTSAYAVASYPTARQLATYGLVGPRSPGTKRGRLFNAGYAQALLNVAAMRAAGLDSPAVWVDVEPVSAPAPWSGRPGLNKQVVDGVLAGYRAEGLEVGFYSVATLWRAILGNQEYGLPEWRSAGPQNRRAALEMCGRGQFQGGSPVIAQWWDDRRDYDVLCPGTPARDVLERWFTRL